MDMKKAETIIGAAAGLQYSDWLAIVEMVERKYQSAMRRVTLTSEDAERAIDAIQAEQPRG